MKLLNFCSVFVLLCGVFDKSLGTNLNCQFKDDIFFMTKYYTCDVTLLDNINIDTVVTGYSGNHNTNQTDIDVKGIWIHDTNTEYIPANLGFLFNLTKFTMFNTSLLEIKTQDFNGMVELIELYLQVNKLTSVPIDAFSTLIHLQRIGLDYNQLEEIQNGAFAKNLQLNSIFLRGNKLKFLGSSLFDGLTKLNFVDLTKNICIEMHYYTSTRIIQVKNDIKIKCKNPNEIPPTTTLMTTQNPTDVPQTTTTANPVDAQTTNMLFKIIIMK